MSDVDASVRSTLKFNMFMRTPKMFISVLPWLEHIKRQSKEMQRALFTCVQTICNLDRTWSCVGLRVTDGNIGGPQVQSLLRDVGLSAK